MSGKKVYNITNSKNFIYALVANGPGQPIQLFYTSINNLNIWTYGATPIRGYGEWLHSCILHATKDDFVYIIDKVNAAMFKYELLDNLLVQRGYEDLSKLISNPSFLKEQAFCVFKIYVTDGPLDEAAIYLGINQDLYWSRNAGQDWENVLGFDGEITIITTNSEIMLLVTNNPQTNTSKLYIRTENDISEHEFKEITEAQAIGNQINGVAFYPNLKSRFAITYKDGSIKAFRADPSAVDYAFDVVLVASTDSPISEFKVTTLLEKKTIGIFSDYGYVRLGTIHPDPTLPIGNMHFSTVKIDLSKVISAATVETEAFSISVDAGANILAEPKLILSDTPQGNHPHGLYLTTSGDLYRSIDPWSWEKIEVS